MNPLHRDDVALAHEQRLPGRLAAGPQRGRLVLRGQTRDVNPEILAVARKNRENRAFGHYNSEGCRYLGSCGSKRVGVSEYEDSNLQPSIQGKQ